MAESSVTIYGSPIDVYTQPDGKQRQVMVIGDPTVQAGAATIVSGGLQVTQQTITKGTQGTRGVSTQDLKDSGRVLKAFSANFTAAITEAMVTLSPYTDSAAGTAAANFTITAGKTFRIQQLIINTRNAGASAQGIVVNLRINYNAATTITSPLIASMAAGTPQSITNVANGEALDLPDGLEISGTVNFGISAIGSANANNTVVLIGYEY